MQSNFLVGDLPGLAESLHHSIRCQS